MLAFPAALLLSAQTALYDSATELLIRFGYLNPAIAGWQIRPEFAAAVSTVYMYTPIAESPPALEVGHTDSAAPDPLIECSRGTGCTIFAERLAAGTASSEDLYLTALGNLLTYYGSPEEIDKTTTAIPATAFSALPIEYPAYIRACETSADCPRDEAPTCCNKTASLPGVCCSTARLNLYDTPVPEWIIIFFLVGAGLVALGWSVIWARRLKLFSVPRACRSD